MGELSDRSAGFLLALVIFLGADLARAVLVAGVTGVAGMAAAVGGPIRRGFGHLCARLPRTDPRGWVSAIFQLALLAVCVLTACANYAVVRDTIRVVWPAELSPGPLALGIVLLTGALGYLLHRAETGKARAAILFVLAVLTLVQADLAYERAKQIAEIDDLLRDAAGGREPAGGVALGGEATKGISISLGEALPHGFTRLLSISLLSALIAGFLCLAEGLATWGVATYSRGEIVWYFCSPLLLLMLGALMVADFVASVQGPLTGAIETVMASVVAFRGRVFGVFRSLIPRTEEWFARRGCRLQCEQEAQRIADEIAAEAASRRHKLGEEEAQRRAAREEREHEEAKRKMARQTDLAKHAAHLGLPIPGAGPACQFATRVGFDGPVTRPSSVQQNRRNP